MDDKDCLIAESLGEETPVVVQRAFGLIIVVGEGRLKADKAQISFWHSAAPVGWRSFGRRDKVDSQSDDRRRVASTACSKLPIDDMLLDGYSK